VFFLGEDFFPSVDAGQMRLHVRGRAGMRVRNGAALRRVEQYLRQQIPKDELVTISTISGCRIPASIFPIATRE